MSDQQDCLCTDHPGHLRFTIRGLSFRVADDLQEMEGNPDNPVLLNPFRTGGEIVSNSRTLCMPSMLPARLQYLVHMANHVA